MTGPETKILTGYGSIAQQHAKPGEVPPTTSGWLSYTLIISRLLQSNLLWASSSRLHASVVLLVKSQVCTQSSIPSSHSLSQFLQHEANICLIMYDWLCCLRHVMYLIFCLFPVRDAEAAFSMPELTYNLNLLIDMAETDIIQTDRQ